MLYPTFSPSNPERSPSLGFPGTFQGNPGRGRPCRDCALARAFPLRRRHGVSTPAERAGAATVLAFVAHQSLYVIARSEATKQSIFPRAEVWIASLRSQ